MSRILLILTTVSTFTLLISCISLESPIYTQNKLRYDSFDWKYVDTEHARIYFYGGLEAYAQKSGAIIESHFHEITGKLELDAPKKVSLFLYHTDFDYANTNVTEGLVDGSGGFTEFYKERIALFPTGSDKRLKDVVLHETTHAWCLQSLLSKPYRSLQIYLTAGLTPDWAIEGLAEFLSNDYDSTAEMLIRDAVMDDALLPLRELKGFASLPRHRVLLAYKEAYLFISYIVNRCGIQVIPNLLELMNEQPDWNLLLLDSTGIAGHILAKDWFDACNAQMKAQAANKVELPPYPGASAPGANFLYPVAAGEIVYCLSDFVNGSGTYNLCQYSYGRMHCVDNHVEVLPSGLAISADKKNLVFACKKRGMPHLGIASLEGKLETVRIPHLESFSYPGFLTSSKVILIGLIDGASDIYLYDLETKRIEQLTDSVEGESYVTVHPAGDRIVFSREYNDQYDLVEMDLKTFKETRLTNTPWNEIQSTISYYGDAIVYSADEPDVSGMRCYNMHILNRETLISSRRSDVIGGLFMPSPIYDNSHFLVSQFRHGRYCLSSVSVEQ